MEQHSIGNRILRRLSRESFKRIAPHLRFARLQSGDELFGSDAQADLLWFIEDGLSAVFVSNNDGESVGINLIGREGVAGVDSLLTNRPPKSRVCIQIGGSAYSVPVLIFRSTWSDDRTPSALLLQYGYVLTQQLAHTLLANARYSSSARLSRWLLMCHDRLDGDNLPITHDLLGAMLGMRRSWVTQQIHILEGLRIVRATRGNIRILDRRQLRATAGSCYGEPERLYDALMKADNALADPVCG